MKTLLEEIEAALDKRDVAPLTELLGTYEEEKDAAKCYSTLAYLCSSGAGGGRELAADMAEAIEAFFLATSIHDDALDRQDGHVRRRSFTFNSYLVLGDCFFVRLAVAFARAAQRMPPAAFEVAAQRLEHYLHDVAESQVADEQAQGRIPHPSQAVRQMKLRGGTWGRLCTEVPALAAGLPVEEADKLGEAAEDLFMALTIRDDLRDLADDLDNGILTLAPALLLGRGKHRADLELPLDARQYGALIDLLHDEGCVEAALAEARSYADGATRKLEAFLLEREDMSWYLLLMIFRLVRKKTEEFTPLHVREGNLGIGFSGIRPDGLATIGL